MTSPENIGPLVPVRYEPLTDEPLPNTEPLDTSGDPLDDTGADVGFIPGFGDSDQPEAGPQQDRQERSRRFIGRGAIGGAIAHISGRAFRKSIDHDRESIRGQKKVIHTEVDPRTGHRHNTEIMVSPAYMPSIGKTATTKLAKHEFKTGQSQLNEQHPWFNVGEDIRAGKFSFAAEGIKAIDSGIEHADSIYVSGIARLGDKVAGKLSQEHGREQRIRNTYRASMQTAYRLVRDAPYLPLEDRLNPRGELKDGCPHPASDEIENADWSAVLDPRNVQALRSHVTKQFITQGGEMRMLRTYVESGAIHAIAPNEFAAYLGVDPEALSEQLKNPKDSDMAVVSPMVLTKLRFLLLFADPITPTIKVPADGDRKEYEADGLPRELATFIGHDPLRPVEAAADTTPIERMLAATDAAKSGEGRREVSDEQKQARFKSTIERRVQAAEADAAARKKREREQKRDKSWESTLVYVSGTNRQDEPGTAFPSMSVESLQSQFRRQEYRNLLKKYGLDDEKVKKLSDDDRSELEREADDIAGRLAKLNFDRLVNAGDDSIYEAQFTAGEGHKVRKSQAEILQMLNTLRQSKSTT